MHPKQDLPVSLHFRVNINYLYKSYIFFSMGRALGQKSEAVSLLLADYLESGEDIFFEI